jgi:hypothetical protein
VSAPEELFAHQLRCLRTLDGWVREHAFDEGQRVPCARCAGRGRVPGARGPRSRACPSCRGEGGRIDRRRWCFDFAWPDLRVAVEIEGGGWVAGRHTRGPGFEADCEKYAEAATRGWTVLRVTPSQVRAGRALAWAEAVLRAARARLSAR